MAHKKGASSSKNGRDSESKRLGAKRADGQFVLAGNILYRQRGTKIHPGTNVRRGSDDTLYTTISGYGDIVTHNADEFANADHTHSQYLTSVARGDVTGKPSTFTPAFSNFLAM